MPKKNSRWIVASILFTFLLFHQADKTILAPLITSIMGEFRINEAQMGAVSSFGIIVSSLLYPLWGYLYDRFERTKLLSLASLIWGITTALSAIAPNFRLFMLSRASTGIDDSSYPGLYSLLSDYFDPGNRGKVYGLMQMSGPFGYLLGMLLATFIGPMIGWRNIFIATGSVGIIMALIIFLGIKDRPRGSSEPELRELAETARFKLSWKVVKALRKNKSLLLLIAHGFVGLFTWNVLMFWMFHYLEVERGYSALGALIIMLIANLALVLGYLFGGNLGDRLFEIYTRGRMALAAAGTFLGGGTLVFSFILPLDKSVLFLVFVTLTGFFSGFVSPNIMATMHDITLPEVRSTAQAFRQLCMDSGAAVAPFAAGLIAVRTSLHQAILTTSIVSWLLGTILVFTITAIVSNDIIILRQKIKERAENLKTI